MDTIIPIFIIVTLLAILYFNGPYNEKFASNLSIIDPYSLYLHENISEKENRWNELHKTQYYYDPVPISH